MKKLLYTLVCLLGCVSCSIDLKDELNPAKEDEAITGKLTIDVCVASQMVAQKNGLSQTEYTVSKYNLYVFDVVTDALEYAEKDIVPVKMDAIAGSTNYLLDTKEIELPSAGKKYVLAVANPNSEISMPQMTTMLEDEEGATLLTEFRKEFLQTISKAPASPLVMTAETYVSTSDGAELDVIFNRTVSKVNIINNATSDITIASISVVGATSAIYPFAEEYSGTSATIDYETITAASGKNVASFYLLPANASQVKVVVVGTLNNQEITHETVLNSQIYSDYEYNVEYQVAKGAVKSVVSPDFSGEVVESTMSVSGKWTSATNEITLPYAAEPNYGFTVDLCLEDETASVQIIKDDSADWYDVSLEGTQIRVRTLKENAGSSRTSSFNVTAGSDFIVVNVIQQGLEDIKTVSFNGLEWMDRNVGATLRANMAGAGDIRSYGYLYQWGRNVPFPVEGDIETVAGQMTAASANATHKFIVADDGTQDWNSAGIEGTVDDYWEKVSDNPCPNGYRLPTYGEIESILPYRLNSLIYAKGKQNRTVKRADGSTYDYLGYGIGAITAYQEVVEIHGIVNYGTDDAYYIRWQLNNTGGRLLHDDANNNEYIAEGVNVVRISIVKGNAASTYESLAKANEFWASATPEADLYLPCSGRRDAKGVAVETGNAGFYWSRSMYKGNNTENEYASGLMYFRPAGKYMLMTAPSLGTAEVYTKTEAYGFRNQAYPIRCVKE